MPEGGVNLVAILLAGTLAAFLFIGAIVVFVMQYYKRVFMHRAELQAKEKEKERELLIGLMRGQEHEQQRMAEELHDGLAIDVTVIKQQLYLLKKQLPDEIQAIPQLETIKEMLTAVGENIRAMSHNLTPVNIEKFGLIKTLNEMMLHINRSEQIKAELKVAEELVDVKLDTYVQLMIYRIVQELIQNIHKHAEATAICIHIFSNDGRMAIEVSDNGKGFPAGEGQMHIGIGLGNIKNRAQLINAEFDIKQNYPKGTKATLLFNAKMI